MKVVILHDHIGGTQPGRAEKTMAVQYRFRLSVTLSAIVVGLLALATACGNDGGASPTGTSQATRTPSDSPMLEVQGIADWINSEPLTISDLTAEGNVVLVDFWTYTCVNCLRTLPFLRDWHAKYADRGLVILGVHSPEFEFEKVPENVRKAVADEGVGWAVALDNDFATWNAFGNRYWPAKYLIDTSGKVIYSHFGEGEYAETEQEIRDALEAAGHDVSDIDAGTVDNRDRDSGATRVTREIYGGYGRSYGGGLYAGNEQYYIAPDRTLEYMDDGNYVNDRYYLEGMWTNAEQAIIHARGTENLEDHIALRIQARSANVVVEPQGPEPFDVFVFLDGNPLTAEEAGDDVMFDDQGRSYITVDEPRMYRIVEQPEFAERVLKLASNSDNFAMFAFTFGVYEEGF